MKQSPDDRKVMERMRPGVLCLDGFLGADSRTPWEIIDADSAIVEQLGLNHDEIAEGLREILGAAAAGMGALVRVGPDDRLEADYREAMGRIPSPWSGEGVFPKGEVSLSDPATGTTLHFTPLSVHLIEAHGFYQGRGSRYRLEPDELARMLGLA
jgi:hypothetical protein